MEGRGHDNKCQGNFIFTGVTIQRKKLQKMKKDLTGVLAIFLEFSLPPTSHFISTQKSSLPDVIAKFYSKNSHGRHQTFGSFVKKLKHSNSTTCS
jgi:hypothetical protein